MKRAGAHTAKAPLDNAPPKNVRMGYPYYTGKGVVLENRAATHQGYFEQILDRLKQTQVTRDVTGHDLGKMPVEKALRQAAHQFRKVHDAGGRLWFVGNGGSAAIASHMCVDFTKNGGVRSLAFNDAPTLTCLGNDFGYDRVFEKQLEYQGTERDAVVVISSSGRSLNIVGAANKAREMGCDFIVTLSGMNPNNKLRQLGHMNFYVPAMDYGIVEICHLTLLHSMVGTA